MDATGAGHEEIELDEGIVMRYEPGFQPGLITVVAGPAVGRGGAIEIWIRKIDGSIERQAVRVGERVSLTTGSTVHIERYLRHAMPVERPRIVPVSRRNSDAGEQFSMIQLEIENKGQVETKWLAFHAYVFPSRQYHYLGRFFYNPTRFQLPGGEVIEAVFSRQRQKLPRPVVLEDFKLTSHVGGYTGETGSIRDWTSYVRFLASPETDNPDLSGLQASTFGAESGMVVDEGMLGEVRQLSTNAPIEDGGMWFFQSYWDKPFAGPGPSAGSGLATGAGSSGFNFTGLGVGNRRGVFVQLVGCCIAVVGMLYAFYVKPILIRRRKLTKAPGGGESSLSGLDNPLDPTSYEHGDQPFQTTGRFKAYVGVVMGLVVLGAVLMYGRSRSQGKVETQVSEFARQVDLSPLRRVAVQTSGRLKSFDAFAHEMMQYVSGPYKIKGQEAMFSYLDLMFRPDLYRQADIIYVKNKSLRRQIAQAVVRSGGVPKGWFDTYVKGGLISAQLLQQGEVRLVLNQLGKDLVRTAKHVNALESAQVVMRSEFLSDRFRVIPPTGEGGHRQWKNLNEATGATVSDWDELADRWRDEDVAKVNAAVVKFASAVNELVPNNYPSLNKLEWDSRYFQLGNMTWVWLVYMLSVLFLLMALVYRWKGARVLGLSIFMVAFGLHTAALGLRWYVSGRWPNTNMFEAVTTATWFGGCAAIVIELLARRSRMRNLFALGSACASMAALMAVHFLPLQLNPAIGNKMPILHDIWLYIHTNVIIFSYCLIGMAAVTGTLYLLWRAAGGAMDFARTGGAASLMQGELPGAGKTRDRVSAGVVFDGATMVLMELAFVLLWTGIVMGAIWADHSWGRPWGWDPKEVFALNTFIVFLSLIHVRMKVRDKGFWTAILAVAGCGVMLFNWIVINFVISGLHSYA
ncbi:MAG: cytochrome c biogenesis protein CcsA [Planctomycetes bacterium]|nr:cytochrome c biogenesis protein CcsA [Planctomycetota bacterium]